MTGNPEIKCPFISGVGGWWWQGSREKEKARFASGFTVRFIYKALPALLNCLYPAFVKKPKGKSGRKR